MDIQRANQKLAARVIELERSGAVLRELLRQKVGNDGLLDVINALTKTALDSSALLQPELTSKFTEHTVPTSVVHQHLNFSTRNTPSGREATEDYKKIVATLFS